MTATENALIMNKRDAFDVGNIISIHSEELNGTFRITAIEDFSPNSVKLKLTAIQAEQSS